MSGSFGSPFSFSFLFVTSAFLNNKEAKKLLVTGAGGYIGKALASGLREAGHAVQCHYRKSHENMMTDDLVIDFATGSISVDALVGVSAIYHCAGIAHQSALKTEYERINHTATVELANNAKAAGVKSFVFLSSVKAERGASSYGRYKRATELALQELADEAFPVAIVRPSLVYGSPVVGNIRSLMSAARRGLPLPPDIGGRSMVAREDLIKFLVALSSARLPAFCCVSLTDGEVYSSRRLVQAFRQSLGKNAVGVVLPELFWRRACAVMDRLRPREETWWDKIFGEEIVSNQAAMELLPWRPNRTFEDSVGEMLSQ